MEGWLFHLGGFSGEEVIHQADAAHDRARADAIREDFAHSSEADQRQKAIAKVVRRRGQAKFRKTLLEAYRGRCAISGCDAVKRWKQLISLDTAATTAITFKTDCC